MTQEFKPGDFLKPILPGRGATDYERYLRTDELLSLQKPAEERRHPDELTFQVVHQSSELMLKAVANELERAKVSMSAGNAADAARLVRRANLFMDHVIGLLHVLETLTPYDYHLIRAGLGHGSGLQSPGFLGLLALGPRLAESFDAQLEAAGTTLEEMYRRNAEFFALHELAERLLDFDERLQAFRYHHLKLAERIIGGQVIGTGGNPVDILRQRQEHTFFKALWGVRNEITERVNARYGEQATGHGEE